MYSTHATDVVGYTYDGDTYCADHKPTQRADSLDTPNPVFGSDVESSDDRCAVCGESLIPE